MKRYHQNKRLHWSVVAITMMMLAYCTKKRNNVAASFSFLRIAIRRKKAPFLTSRFGKGQIPQRSSWEKATSSNLHRGQIMRYTSRISAAAATATSDEDETNNPNSNENDTSGLSNTEQRQAAFDAILFETSEPSEPTASSISSTEAGNATNGAIASSQPPPMDDYGDSFSPFDFGYVEEDDQSTIPKDKFAERTEDEYPMHLYEDMDENQGYSLVQEPGTPPTSPEKETAEGPLFNEHDKEKIVAKAKASLSSVTSNENGSFHERNSLDILEKASYGNGVTTDVQHLESRLQSLKSEIYAQNNGKEFNVNSPKQVSEVLFGSPSQSTNKATLEAMGSAGNTMADLILQYRQCARDIKRAKRKSEKGSVTNVMETQQKRSEIDEETENALLLVDASAYIFRAYYSMPPLHRSDGMPVGAVLGFCNMLNRLVLHRLLRGECPRLVLVFDAKGKTFRHDLYPDYKANRKECPMDLIPQFDLIREVADAYGIQQVEAKGYEADDVIATLASMALAEGVNVNILSGDKDLMQLVTPEEAVPSVHIIDPMRMARITHDVVVEKWGVPPDQVGDMLALAGDSSDNVPGVPGIGPKIAAQLLEQFGSLETLLEKADTIPQKARREKVLDNKDKAILSRELVELERQIPLENTTFPENLHGRVADLRMEELNSNRLSEFYAQMGFKDLKRRFQDRLVQRDRRNANAGARTKGTPRKTAAGKNRYYSKRPKASIPKPEDYEDVPF